MHEDLAAVVAGEEAIPLVGVVPLDLAGRHRADLTLRERATTSDQVTDRMLWAVPRLSVRDAGSQPRYHRPLGPAPLRAAGGRPRPVGYPALRPGNLTPNGPGGNPPGRWPAVTSWIRSPCHRRHRAWRGPCPSPASPRSRPRW